MALNIKPAIGEIVHVFNRGVDKREIFLDDGDRFRFVHDLYEFNDSHPALSSYYEVGLRKVREHDRLVSVLAFCMMPNHFHLLLSPEKESGVTEFMRKIGTGYTNYFNKKYDRSGHLFQGKFKIQLSEKENYYGYIPDYIHLNPVKLIFPNWKEVGINKKDEKKAVEFLKKYKWSSLQDYIGIKNFPSILNKELVFKYFESGSAYKNRIIKILRSPTS